VRRGARRAGTGAVGVQVDETSVAANPKAFPETVLALIDESA
jgi:hypothetical protein